MNKKLILSLGFLSALLFFPLRAGGLTQETELAGPLADVQVSAQGLVWQPLVESVGWTLRIAMPDGRVYGQSFAAGEQPFFSLTDATGQPLADGVYTYELFRQVPASEAEKNLDPGVEGVSDLGEPPAALLTQGGVFTILDGAAYLPDPSAVEGPSTDQPVPPLSPDDYVLTEDLIVTQNACIGASCAADMAWTYTPLTLRYVDDRIFFDDPSTSAGFPTNDWAILINDSAQYGAEYFAVQDYTNSTVPFKIRQSAPDNSLYISPSGDIGFGTASPSGELTLADEYQPSLTLQQTIGTYPNQRWDLSGDHTRFFLYDGNNFKTPFGVEVNAPDNSLFVENTGNVGVGTNAPLARLHVVGDLRVDGFVNERSDRASKTAFAAVDNQEILERLASLPVSAWSYKESPGVRHIGPMAQDFRLAFGLGPDDQHIAALDANGVALAAIQALDEKVKGREAQIQELQARFASLETRLAARQSLVSLLCGLLGVFLGLRLGRKR